MAISLCPNATKQFVLPEDRETPKDQQTVFRIKVFSAGEFRKFLKKAKIITSKKNDDRTLTETCDEILELCKQGVVGWQNLKDQDGQDVPFSADRLEDLPNNHLYDLLYGIIELNTVGAQNQKN